MTFLFIFVIIVVFGGKFVFELVHGAAGFVHEASQVAGHLRDSVGAEDHQDQQADNDHLLRTDTEHGLNISLRGRAYNEFYGTALYSDHETLYKGPYVISWGAVRTIAVTLASRTESSIRGDFDYSAAVGRALDPLYEFTGISLPPGGRQLRIADRAEWIDFNIEGFEHLMEPVLRRASEGADNITWAVGGVTLTAQVGLLLGFLSARVLGQYDTGPLLVSGKEEEPGKVFFLDGNIVSAAGRLGVPVDGLRFWIVLHEMTHALQFEGYPWLRAHLGMLLEQLLQPLSERIGVRETLRRLTENVRSGGRSVELMMSRSQRESFDTMQAAMSVIEGYSDYVMHHVGKRIVPGYEYLSARMARSRMHRPPLETAIFRLTGLDVKLEQYRLGERFADAVAARQGMEGLNRVWDRPENLPTLKEVRDPGLWMLRMETT